MVKFLQAWEADNLQFNVGDCAAFEQPTEEMLITDGIAEQMPKGSFARRAGNDQHNCVAQPVPVVAQKSVKKPPIAPMEDPDEK